MSDLDLIRQRASLWLMVYFPPHSSCLKPHLGTSGSQSMWEACLKTRIMTTRWPSGAAAGQLMANASCVLPGTLLWWASDSDKFLKNKVFFCFVTETDMIGLLSQAHFNSPATKRVCLFVFRLCEERAVWLEMCVSPSVFSRISQLCAAISLYVCSASLLLENSSTLQRCSSLCLWRDGEE